MTTRGRFLVYWGRVYLGWTDSRQHAEGVIRQHLARRRRGQHDPAYLADYRIVDVDREEDA